MTSEDLGMEGSDSPVWLMDYQEMWVELYELMVQRGEDDVVNIMQEMEQTERTSVLVREELWKKSQKKS